MVSGSYARNKKNVNDNFFDNLTNVIDVLKKLLNIFIKNILSSESQSFKHNRQKIN